MVGSVGGENVQFPFKLRLPEVKQLLESADGMQSYAPETGWQGYPQRSKNEWGAGFADTFEFKSGIVGAKEGALSAEEAGLAMKQLFYDVDERGQQPNNPQIATDPSVNDKPITQDKAHQGLYFLGSIYDDDGKIHKGLDANGDEKFTYEEDAVPLAKPGSPNFLTDNDIQEAAAQD